MKKRGTLSLSMTESPVRLDSNFWVPPAADVIRADVDEFARQFGLMPELAEVLGLRQYLREDTLKGVN